MSEHKDMQSKITLARSDEIHIALRMEGTRKEATVNLRVHTCASKFVGATTITRR
jgi:hypothetical protein